MEDLIITSLETITAFDLVSGDYLFTIDEPQDATIAQTQDKNDITGKNGRKLSSLKRNKAVTISGNNGLLSGGLMELQVGSSFRSEATAVKWSETLSVSSQTATTAYKAIGTPGAEIEALYMRNSDGTRGSQLTQDSSASAGKFAYAPATKTLSFHTDIADGTEIVVFYSRRIQAQVLDNESDRYSGKCTLYIDAIGENKCGKIYHIQFHIPKADFNGEFSLEFSENQTVHAFEAEALSGACGAGGKLWSFIVFGEDEPDAPALSSIAVTTAPTTTSYSAGQAFNASGMVVTATYADSTTKTVTNYTFAPIGALTTSDTAVTITYSESGVTKTATQSITVSA